MLAVTHTDRAGRRRAVSGGGERPDAARPGRHSTPHNGPSDRVAPFLSGAGA